MLYFDATGYYNSEDPLYVNSASLRHIYHFDTLNKIDGNVNAVYTDYGSISPNDKHNTHFNAYIRSLNTIANVDISNQITYKNGYSDLKAGINYNAALTYRPTAQVTLFLKGINLFGSALKTDYLRIDPLSGTETRINDVDVMDRSVWAGLEYLF